MIGGTVGYIKLPNMFVGWESQAYRRVFYLASGYYPHAQRFNFNVNSHEFSQMPPCTHIGI